VAKVRVETGNQSGKLKPEMFATGIASSTQSEYHDNITIPKSSLLWTGKRSIVYVKQTDSDEPVFKIREVELGPMLGESYVIMNGLAEGEEVVTNGAFSVDAAAQLDGKPSMMNKPITGSLNKEHAIFKVAGNCDMCKERIEKAALAVKGVTNASWNMNNKEIILDFDSTQATLITVHKAIAKVGHDTELFKADDVIYRSLPSCCLYRK
jgi:Cu(I)/Ag(I) efflux system membrane fusion protein